MPLPTFLIIGAARSATTSLHYYLRAHPQIGMSVTKEPNFFLFRHQGGAAVPLIANDPRLVAKSVTDQGAYEKLFPTDPGIEALGEASPLYLYAKETPELIKDTLEDVKLIAILRDPIARAHSHYATLDHGSEAEMEAGFRRAVETELQVDGYSPYAIGTHVLRLGRYGEQVERYLEHFPADRLLLLTFDEVSQKPKGTLLKICEFLDVDPTFEFGDLIAYNGSKGNRSRLGRAVRSVRGRVQPFLKKVLPNAVVAPLARARAKMAKPADAVVLPDDLQAKLEDYFADDLRKLVDLTGLDIRTWPTAARLDLPDADGTAA